MKPPGDWSGGSNGAPKKAGAGGCPICGKPVQKARRPFCSDRCANVDLNRWLSDRYLVKGQPLTGADDAEQQD